MKSVIVSDTHGNSTLLQGAIYTAQEQGCSEIWHLGDNYEDLEHVSYGNLFIRRVPGLWCSAYRAPFIPNLISFNCLASSVTLVHDIHEGRHLERSGPWVFFHGHSHHPAIEQTSTTLYINPGHLKKSFDRGFDATYLIAQSDESLRGMTWTFWQYNYKDELLAEISVRLEDDKFHSPHVRAGSFLGKLTA